MIKRRYRLKPKPYFGYFLLIDQEYIVHHKKLNRSKPGIYGWTSLIEIHAFFFENKTLLSQATGIATPRIEIISWAEIEVTVLQHFRNHAMDPTGFSWLPKFLNAQEKSSWVY